MLTAGVAVDKATLDFDRIFSYTVPDIFKDEIKTRTITGLAIDNGAAVVFDGDKIYALNGNDGGDAYFLSNDGTKHEKIESMNA